MHFAAARYPAERIVLWGESLGSGVAVALAASTRSPGLMLEAPFTSAADVGARVYWFLPVRLLMKDPFRSDLRIAKVTVPLLILHGARDSVVPFALGERLFCARERAQALRPVARGRPQRPRPPRRAQRGAGVSRRNGALETAVRTVAIQAQGRGGRPRIAGRINGRLRGHSEVGMSLGAGLKSDAADKGWPPSDHTVLRLPLAHRQGALGGHQGPGRTGPWLHRDRARD